MGLSPAQKASYDEMSMSEKIAILLLQLGEETTAEIFSNSVSVVIFFFSSTIHVTTHSSIFVTYSQWGSPAHMALG